MKPKKVLIIITKSNWGGAQRFVFDLATRLPKEKYNVEVMAGGGGELIGRLAQAGVKASGDLPVERDVNLRTDFVTFIKLWSIFRRNKPDIIHVNSSKIGVLGAVAGRLSGVPRIIFTAHGWAFNEDRSLISKNLLRLIYWLAMLFAHQTLTVSEAAKHQVEGWYGLARRLKVVHNGTESIPSFARGNARFSLASINDGVKDFLNAHNERNIFWIGTVAELHHIKGHEYALHAIRRCLDEIKDISPKTNILYTIIGEGEERNKIEAQIKELGLEKNVFLLGHIKDAAQYFKAFDMFLLSSISESLGYVLIESGRAQIPVVATAVGGIPEIVEDMDSGILVQPRNHRELSHAILFMIEHPDERKRYASALCDKVNQKFSIERMVEGVMKTYENLK